MRAVSFRAAATDFLPNHVRAAIKHADFVIAHRPDGAVVIKEGGRRIQPRVAEPKEISRCKRIRT